MAQIVWTEPALEDLDDIADYISLSNAVAASDLVMKVFSGVGRLEQFPESGRVPEEVGEFQYREVVVNPVRVFYKLQDDRVYILHVLRQERDVRQYILGYE